jgi:hypothetical protein
MPYQFTLKVKLTKPKPKKDGEVVVEEGVS